ncbi:MAG: secretin N-terminal domain-containing protein, partial [Planctomycetota bacterium]
IIIQSTSDAEVDLVKRLIDELDTKARSFRANTHIYRVKFLKAEDLADDLTRLVEGTGTGSLRGRRTTAQRGQRTAAQATGQQQTPSRIIAHDETNSIIIQADPEEYEEILRVLEGIDRKRRQVFLEAALVQVNENSSLNYTFEYLAGNLDDNATRVAALAAFGLTSIDVSQLPGNFDRFFPDTAPSTGLILAASHNGRSPFLMRAIKNDTETQILATPFILADDNQENSISVQTELFFEASAQGQVAVTTTQESEEAGITLTLLPTISENVVLLDLQLEVSAFANTSTLAGSLPDKTVNILSSRVTIPDGELFIIGGLAREGEAMAVDKIPILGDLPLIGRFFQSRGVSHTRDNLFVFLTAHILTGDDYGDLRNISRQAREGMRSFGEDLRVQQFQSPRATRSAAEESQEKNVSEGAGSGGTP